MFARNSCCLCVCVAAVLGICYADIFSSTTHLRTLVSAEEEMIRKLEEYAEMEDLRLRHYEQFVHDIRTERRGSSSALEDSTHKPYGGSMLEALRLLNKFGVQWRRIYAEATKKENAVLMTQNLELKDIPTREDFEGAAHALIRLQRTYQLSTAEIATGRVNDLQAIRLGSPDCELVADMGMKYTDYDLAAEWYIQAAEIDPELNRTAKSRLLSKAAHAYETMRDYAEAANMAEKALDLDEANEKAYDQAVTNYEAIERKGADDKWARNTSYQYNNYEALCRGENLRSPNETKDLYCHNRAGEFPYELVKEEILSLDPRISVFYDVMSLREAQAIKDLVKERLERSQVVGGGTTYIRVSKTAWVSDVENPLVKKLAQRAQRYTGLDLESSEPFQVVNYGVGGQYEPHDDALGQRDGFGDRLATFLYYLSTVDAGGATVFPWARVRVAPVAHAAALWYNLFRSGEKDYRLKHAGCPVLVGEKWISNKWIHERRQEFRRPCDRIDDSAREFEHIELGGSFHMQGKA